MTTVHKASSIKNVLSSLVWKKSPDFNHIQHFKYEQEYRLWDKTDPQTSVLDLWCSHSTLRPIDLQLYVQQLHKCQVSIILLAYECMFMY